MSQIVNTTHPILMPTRDGAGAQISGTTDYSAEETRRWIDSIRGRGGGPLLVGDLVVSPLGTPGAQVLVSPGRIWVPNTFSVNGGVYLGIVAAQGTLDVPAADLSQQRNDAVFYEVQDKDYDTSTVYNGRLRYVTNGTLGSGAAYPTPSPASSNIMLAQVRVPAGGTTVVDGSHITNVATLAALRQSAMEMGQLPGIFASIVAAQSSGSGNTIGDIVMSLRKATGDAALTEMLRMKPAGGISVPASPGGAYAPTSYGTFLNKIDEKVLGGLATSWPAIAVPSGALYRGIIIAGKAQGNVSIVDIGYQFNGDTANDYSVTQLFASSGTPQSGASAVGSSALAAQGTSGSSVVWLSFIGLPSDTSLTNKPVISVWATAGLVGIRSSYWNNSGAAISSILGVANVNMIANSWMGAYGIP